VKVKSSEIKEMSYISKHKNTFQTIQYSNHQQTINPPRVFATMKSEYCSSKRQHQTSPNNSLILARKPSRSNLWLFWCKADRQELWFCCTSCERSYASNASFNTSQFADPAKSGFSVKWKSDFNTKMRSTV
jgi:hypothetical protein